MNTQQLTRGAMTCAIYGVLLFLNQQTGMTIETSASWIFIFPILIYTAMYGAKTSSLVAIAMALMTFLFGGFTTWFYSWSAILMGYVYGSGIYQKFKNITNFILLFIFSFISTVMMVYLWAGVFGMDMTEDFQWITQYISFIRWDAFVFMVVLLMAVMQAICVHLVAIMLCQRLNIEMIPLHGLNEISSPRWVGVASIIVWLAFFLGQNVIELSTEAQSFLQILWFVDCVILDFYGVIYFMTLVLKSRQRKRAPLAILGAFIPIVQMLWILSGEMDCLLQIRKNYLDSRF